VNYARNVWHHPLLVLEPDSTFLVLDCGNDDNNLEEYWFPEDADISLDPVCWSSPEVREAVLALEADGLGLFEHVYKIHSLKDFKRLLIELSADFGKSSETWENVDLSSYLGALVNVAAFRCENLSEKDEERIDPYTLRLVGELLLAAQDYD
jgi:hypothetical protein